jgi:hypothetical protein
VLVLSHVLPGAHAYVVDDSNDSDPNPEALAPGSARTDVVEGGEHEVVLHVPARVRVTGRVLEGGRPPAIEATTTLRFVPRRAGGTDVRAFVALSGEYTTAPLAPGEYRVLVTNRERFMEFESATTIDAAHARFDIELPLTTIEGLVLDNARRPVAGASLAIERGSSRTSAGTSAADGTFALHGVQPDADLVVVASWGDSTPARSETLRMKFDETRRGVELVLWPGATLDVTVVAIDGRPVPGRQVRARRDGVDQPAVSVQTGVDGVARFHGLAPGAWRVRVEARSIDPVSKPYDETSVNVDVGRANSARIELPR